MRHLIYSWQADTGGPARKSRTGKALFLMITSVLALHNAFSGGSLLGADQPPNIVLIISDD